MDASKLRKRIVELEEQLSSTIQADRAQISSFQNEVANLTSQLESKEAENQRMQLTVETLHISARSIREEKEQIEEDSKRLIENQNTKALELARRCNKLKEDNEVLKKEISDQDSKLTSIKKELKEIKNQNKLLQNENSSCIRSNKDLENQLRSLQENYHQSQVQVVHWKAKVDQITEQDKNTLKQLETSAKQVSFLQNALEQEKVIQQNITVENEKMKECTARCEIVLQEEKKCRQTIEKVSKQHQNDCREKEEKIEELVQEMKKMHKEQRFCVEKTHLDLQRKENSLQTVTKELQCSKELCASLRRQLEEMTDLHASLKNSTSEATRKYKDLVREVKKFAKQIEVSEAPPTGGVTEVLRKCQTVFEEKDHLISQLEGVQSELQRALQQSQNQLKQSRRANKELECELGDLQSKMEGIHGKITQTEEVLVAQNKEMESLQQRLSHTVLENSALKASREEEVKMFRSEMHSLMTKMADSLEAPTDGTLDSSLQGDSIEKWVCPVNHLLDQLLGEYAAAQNKAAELHEMLRSADVTCSSKVKEVSDKHRKRIDKLQNRLKLCVERESKMSEQFREASLVRESLLVQARALEHSVTQLSGEKNVLQSLLVIMSASLVGSLDRVGQLCLQRRVLEFRVSQLEDFQSSVRAYLETLRDLDHSPQKCFLPKFRTAVIVVLAVNRLRLISRSRSKCLTISPKDSPLAAPLHLHCTDSLTYLSLELRTSTMEALQPLTRSVTSCMQSGSTLNIRLIVSDLVQSLSTLGALFGGEVTLANDRDTLCSALHRGLKRTLAKGKWRTLQAPSLLSELSSVIHQMLNHVQSVKEEKSKLELLLNQVSGERNALALSAGRVPVLEAELTGLQMEFSSMIRPDVHEEVREDLRQALERERELHKLVVSHGNHLKEADLRMSDMRQELEEKTTELTVAVENITDVKLKLSSKEKHISYLERSLGTLSKDQKSLQVQLRSLTPAVEGLASDKENLLGFLKVFNSSLEKVAERGLISLSETSKSNDGSEINIMFANVTPNPNIPHCKELKELVCNLLLQGTTHLATLRQEASLCNEHLTSLRQELQDIYKRTNINCL